MEDCSTAEDRAIVSDKSDSFPIIQTQNSSLEEEDLIDENTKELLAKMDEINRHLETDSRSIKSLKVHSRQPSSSSQFSSHSNAEDPQREKNDFLLRQWSDVIKTWEVHSKRKHFLQNLIRQGIPHNIRPLAWQYICGAHDSPLQYDYAEFLRQPSAYEKHIRRDIARTFPQHEMFKEKNGLGQESLFNVMKAYSLYDREVGYCQGSGFIVGLLLMVLPEEDAFAVLVQMMLGQNLRELYKPKMYELGLRLFQLESLIQEHVSVQLAAHMRAQAFHASLYASSWFLTLFTTTFSPEVAFRIMDLVLFEGLEIVFKVALAYLQLVGEDLLNLDMEAMLNYMQHKAPQKIEEEPNVLFHQAFTIKINHKLMKRLEREYSVMKSSELEIDIELRRLRTENGILLQRLDRLEAENNHLTDKLVNVQLQRACEDAESSELKRQLSQLKNQRCRDVGLQHQDPSEPTTVSPATSWTSMSDPSEMTDSEKKLAKFQAEYERVSSLLADFQARCSALQEENERLARHPPNDVATLQEELIAAKLREAEANLNMREVRKRLHDLEKEHQLNSSAAANSSSSSLPTSNSKPSLLSSALKSFNSNSSQQQQQLNEEVTRLKLREASQHAELIDLRTTMMELQTQNQLNSRQLKRQDEEMEKLRDQLDSARGKVSALQTSLKEAQHRITDMEAKHKEEVHLLRLNETELTSRLAECQLRTPSGGSKSAGSPANVPLPHQHRTTAQDAQCAFPSEGPSLRGVWKNLPASLMTESIGPLEELCILPDDPMITSIYIDQPEPQQPEVTSIPPGGSNDMEPEEGNSTPIMSDAEDL